ncbi:MAG: hypothetical protein ACD_39C01672G0002 [uncultured bacterium]|nr:MAG: hypothetical protein ACD_39C01672G0002 [uncultured bacterium]
MENALINSSFQVIFSILETTENLIDGSCDLRSEKSDRASSWLIRRISDVEQMTFELVQKFSFFCAEFGAHP